VPAEVAPIAATTFAPPYKSTFLQQNPGLARKLRHVNCSYLTTYDGRYVDVPNLAPSLKELKQHAKALIVLIKHLTVARRGDMINSEGFLNGTIDKVTGELRGGAGAPIGGLRPEDAEKEVDAFAFLNDLSTPYDSNEPDELTPLTSLLNYVMELYTKDGPREAREVCPLESVKPIAKNGTIELPEKANPLPYLHIDTLMKHADDLLLLIDNALQESGGFLSALPLNLAEDDPKRQTFIGQLIHFIRVLVGRVHTLDRDYGQTLDLLAAEATVPKEIKLKMTRPEDLRHAFSDYQQNYILAGVDDMTYRNIWHHLMHDQRSIHSETGRGLLDVTLPTRYRALRGGHTIFITPQPEALVAAKDKPTLVTCVKPGYGTRASEWERKNAAALVDGKDWKLRAERAEEENARLRRDLEALEPEGVWLGDEKTKVLDMWQKIKDHENAEAERATRLKRYTDRIKKQEEEIVELKRKLPAERRGRRAARPADWELHSDISELRAQNESLQNQVKELKALGPAQQPAAGSPEESAEIARLSADARKLREENAKLKTQLQAAGQPQTPRGAVATAQVGRLNQKIEKLKKDVETLNTQVGKQAEENTALTTANDTLKRQNEAQEAEQRRLGGKVEEQDTMIKQLLRAGEIMDRAGAVGGVGRGGPTGGLGRGGAGRGGPTGGLGRGGAGRGGPTGGLGRGGPGRG